MSFIKKYWKYFVAFLAIAAAVAISIVVKNKNKEIDAEIKQKKKEVKELEKQIADTSSDKKVSVKKINRLKKDIEELEKQKAQPVEGESDPVGFLKEFANKKIAEAKGE